VLLACAWLQPTAARAQACCAGAAALTPGRLAPHEQALVGLQLQAALVLGTFDARGRYVPAPVRDAELDLEQDLFGALRVTKRGQLALLVPVLQARRHDRSGSEFGGGVGDINVSARYDFYTAGRSMYLPGIAALGGVSLPTGRPVESASGRLATDATGVGVVQGNLGVALEQLYGRWLIDLTGLLALRATRHVLGQSATLAPQWTVLAALAYTFDHGASLGLSAAYSVEGDAALGGVSQPETSRRRTLVTLSGLWPLADHWHLQAHVSWDPPVSALATNQPQNTGLGAAVIRSW
jgi:hypothetical protein